MKPICIIGSGGFGREVRCLIEDINAEHSKWEIIGFANTDKEPDQKSIEGIPLLSLNEVLNRANLPAFALGIGIPAVKLRIINQLPKNTEYPSLVHPSVIASKRVVVSERGVIITAGNILTTNIQIDEFVMINLACTVGHDVKIGRLSVLSPGVNVSGYVMIQEGCSVGTGAKIIEGMTLGAWSVVGAGAVINDNIPANSTAVGVPGKVIKTRAAGWQMV